MNLGWGQLSRTTRVVILIALALVVVSIGYDIKRGPTNQQSSGGAAPASGPRSLVGYSAGGGSISVAWSCNPIKHGVQQAVQQGTATLKARESTLFQTNADDIACNVLKTSDGDLYLAIKQGGQVVSSQESTGKGGNIYIGP